VKLPSLETLFFLESTKLRRFARSRSTLDTAEENAEEETEDIEDDE
jgi:hypothetical protein